MTIDLSKKYRTRDGRDVRILCTDAPGEYPVIGYAINSDASIILCKWMREGRYQVIDWPCLDLVEVREKRRLIGRLNVYENGVAVMYYQKQCADNAAASVNVARIACIDLSRIEYEVGEGLE